MKEKNKIIIEELIKFQTLGFQCKGLVHYLIGKDDTGDKYVDFQHNLFLIIDKLDNNDLSLSAKDLILIKNIKKIIIEYYKQESLIAQIIRGDENLNDMFDKKISEIINAFSYLKS